MDQHTSVNREFWDEVAPHHAASDYYAVERFVGGRDSLGAIEVAEVGDVAGKDLVHLQCHIGLDTLSWARRGARVTGVDFSSASLRIAAGLARRIGVDARFVESDVVVAPELLGETYDVVFTSRGVLMWMSDLDAWATACARLLKPDGVFYLLEIHPLCLSLLRRDDGAMQVTNSYFRDADPHIVDDDETYAVRDVGLVNSETREWGYPVGDVVSALIRAGIGIEYLHEFPADSLARVAGPPDEEHSGDPGFPPDLPGLFSVRGHLAR